jgi:hypothetical protein
MCVTLIIVYCRYKSTVAKIVVHSLKVRKYFSCILVNIYQVKKSIPQNVYISYISLHRMMFLYDGFLLYDAVLYDQPFFRESLQNSI